jgi:hypothetical protein
MTLGVRIEKVIRAWVILVNALLHETHPEHAGVEVEVFLSRSADSRDVMQPLDALHCVLLILIVVSLACASRRGQVVLAAPFTRRERQRRIGSLITWTIDLGGV